jgi:transglutaminase-like putative cysteine protease
MSALLAFIALLAFVAGAGLDAISVVPAGVLLLLAIFLQPGEERARLLEPLWRAAAFVLAIRAALHVIGGGSDPVLPMVDLLLLLLCAESLQLRDGSGDARHFALTFALLIASAAYRPGPLFGLLFVAYVVCATVVLVLGHLSRQARARHVEPPAPQPLFLMRVALLSTFVLLVSAAVFLFFPRVSRGWAARPAPARAVVGFSDRVTLAEHGARIEPNPEVVMRVEFPGGAPADMADLHWRGRAYDRFDGWAWSRTQIPTVPPIEAARWQSPFIEQVIYARALPDAQVLFGLHPILDITAQSAIRLNRVAHGDYIYFGDVDPAYRVQSRAAAPSAAVLRAVAENPDSLRPAESEAYRNAGLGSAARNYLQLPPLSARTRALADSFRLAATTRYDHVTSIQRWLRTEFGYTLELPQSRREATLDYFLFERRAGHCEYFSTALAVLLRAGGVPARNVNGFLGGVWNGFGRFLTVTQNQAHSWVEVYFPGFGWITFDPTPTAPVTGGSTTGTRLLSRFRFVFEGVEHRWGKWILDYDLGRQNAVLKRLQSPFAASENRNATGAAARSRSLLAPILAASVLLAGVLMVLRRMRWHTTRRSVDTRLYLALRRAYERAGFPGAAALPPLAFAHAVTSAPGGTAARRAVEIYLHARFGPAGNGAPDRAELRRQVTAARRALRRRKSTRPESPRRPPGVPT